MITSLFLLIGGSFTASSFFWQPVSPCETFARELGAPVAMYAHSGKKLHEVMPPDQQIRDAAMVCAPDAFYWYRDNGKEDCEIARAAADHLFAVRGNRPMVLATLPWNHCMNAYLRERCKDACILVESKPFVGLHPNQEYVDDALREFDTRRYRSAL